MKQLFRALGNFIFPHLFDATEGHTLKVVDLIVFVNLTGQQVYFEKSVLVCLETEVIVLLEALLGLGIGDNLSGEFGADQLNQIQGSVVVTAV